MDYDVEVIARTGRGCADRRPPLLFVHGVFHGAWCWDEHFLDFFADHGWDSYALTLRGHRAGDDIRMLRTCRIRDYVEDVRSVADALPEEPVLIGHSMGAYIVGKVVEHRRARAVVLLTPMPGMGALRTPLLRRNLLLLAAGSYEADSSLSSVLLNAAAPPSFVRPPQHMSLHGTRRC